MTADTKPKRSRKKSEAASSPEPQIEAPVAGVHSIKGFDSNLQCRGFQYEVGKTYEIDGDITACERGFHACDASEHPLNVFEFYPPAGARYAAVIQSGDMDHGSSAKIASAKISIEAEIQLPELTQRAVKWVFDRAKWIDGPVATGYNEAATASGYQGAATASGNQGAATASGYRGRARAVDGSALFLVYRPTWDGPILHVWAGIAGRDGVKPNVWYRLGGDGKPVEVTP